MTALARLRTALARSDQVLGAREGEAWVAIPIPRRELWTLLRDPAHVPAGHMVIGTVAVRRAPPALRSDAPDQLQLLLALYRQMTTEQRRQLLEYARSLQTCDAALQITTVSDAS